MFLLSINQHYQTFTSSLFLHEISISFVLVLGLLCPTLILILTNYSVRIQSFFCWRHHYFVKVQGGQILSRVTDVNKNQDRKCFNHTTTIWRGFCPPHGTPRDHGTIQMLNEYSYRRTRNKAKLFLLL